MAFPASLFMEEVGIETMSSVPKQDSKSFDTSLLLCDVSVFAQQAVNRAHRLVGGNDLFRDFAVYIFVYLRSNGPRLYLKIFFPLKRLKEDYNNLWS